MSTIDSGHLEVGDGGQEGPKEAGLLRRGAVVDLRAGAGFRGLGCAGCSALRDEHQLDLHTSGFAILVWYQRSWLWICPSPGTQRFFQSRLRAWPPPQRPSFHLPLRQVRHRAARGHHVVGWSTDISGGYTTALSAIVAMIEGLAQ